MSHKIKRDARKLSQVCHKNIVLFRGIAIDKNHFYTFTEFMSEGSVYDQIHKHKKVLEEKMILKILTSVCRGMTFLHGINKIHGTLRTSNVLISEDWEIKLIDFGFRRLREKFNRFKKLKKRKDAETPYWLAPEILLGQKFSKEIDIYSFGILIQ